MPERVAINTVIQGSAADLIKKAMLEVRELIKTQFPSSQLLLQIHDELVVEAPAQDLIAVAQGIHAAMTQAFSLRVPLNVEVEAGPNWEATQPIDW
jgi:DNA polymerase-1